MCKYMCLYNMRVCVDLMEISVAEMRGKEWNGERGVNPTLMRDFEFSLLI